MGARTLGRAKTLLKFHCCNGIPLRIRAIAAMAQRGSPFVMLLRVWEKRGWGLGQAKYSSTCEGHHTWKNKQGPPLKNPVEPPAANSRTEPLSAGGRRRRSHLRQENAVAHAIIQKVVHKDACICPPIYSSSVNLLLQPIYLSILFV